MRAPATRRTSVAALAAEADPAEEGGGAARAAARRGRRRDGGGGDPDARPGRVRSRRLSRGVRRGREAIAAGGALGGHLLVGDAYYRLERFPDALREYQAALALDPGNTSIKRRRDLVEQAAPR